LVEIPDDAKSIEGRRSPRVRTFLQARVSYSDGAISTVCTVNQLSDVGARINIASTFSLPDTFEIAIPQRSIFRRAKLIWRRDDQAAVDFVDDEESQAAADPAVRIKALEGENAKLKAQISVLLQQISRLTEE
jgi:PilZ domain